MLTMVAISKGLTPYSFPTFRCVANLMDSSNVQGFAAETGLRMQTKVSNIFFWNNYKVCLEGGRKKAKKTVEVNQEQAKQTGDTHGLNTLGKCK